MSSQVIIQAYNLAKQYRLGEVSTGSLGHDVNRWWHRIRGKEDPYLNVTHANVRESKSEGRNEYVWAIKDISFEVRQGEVLGIVGRNGAGKSTLLKILSRITSPTTGEVRIKGRIASLLEVGTGFHQDLTGRENIYMNGAVLGMTKQEIRSKFDEIVAFSGCEKYVDTPVKRYSSGMVVRLGFAVAAHLEPEILIVDEVLAVGDAEFQQKCIGKMKDVAGRGRTVIFVSHNLAAVQNLCQSAIWLDGGMVARAKDAVSRVVASYEQSGRSGSGLLMFDPSRHRVVSPVQISSMELTGSEPRPTINFRYGEPVRIRFRVLAAGDVTGVQLGFTIRSNGLLITTVHSPVFDMQAHDTVQLDVVFPGGVFMPGMFEVDVGAARNVGHAGLDYISDAAVFFVSDAGADESWMYNQRLGGIVHLPVTWGDVEIESGFVAS